jgi:hypothetical protein
MASEIPATNPANIAQRAVRAFGTGACDTSTRISMSNVPLAWVIVVKRNAFDRRAAYPPTKSLVPQAKVAARLNVIGVNRPSASKEDLSIEADRE